MSNLLQIRPRSFDFWSHVCAELAVDRSVCGRDRLVIIPLISAAWRIRYSLGDSPVKYISNIKQSTYTENASTRLRYHFVLAATVVRQSPWFLAAQLYVCCSFNIRGLDWKEQKIGAGVVHLILQTTSAIRCSWLTFFFNIIFKHYSNIPWPPKCPEIH